MEGEVEAKEREEGAEEEEGCECTKICHPQEQEVVAVAAPAKLLSCLRNEADCLSHQRAQAAAW